MERAKCKKTSLRFIVYWLIVISLPLLVTSCGESWSGSWQDEVKLHNGETIWVKRSASYKRASKSFGSFGEGGNITEMAVTIKVPNNNIAPPPPVWRFNAVPIVLDYDKEKKTWFVVATYFYCNSWVDAGRPALKQWQYEVKDNKWVIVPLDRGLLGRPTNLMIDFGVGKKVKKATIKDIDGITKHLLPRDIYKEITISRRSKC